jgi:hypothetical protein
MRIQASVGDLSKTKCLRRRLSRAAILILALSSSLWGQAGRDLRSVARTEKPLNIDGVLSEDAWKRAREATDLFQLHSTGPVPDGLQTSVKILIDSKTLYLGIVCADPHPDQILIHRTDHDADLRTDDSVYVLIDPGRGDDLYLLFGINPWGDQLEGEVARDGQFFNPDWNGEWRSAAQSTDTGWTAELAIPFASLNPQKPPTDLRVMFGRIVPRFSGSFWSGPLDPAFDLAGSEEFYALDLLRGGSATYIRPYVFGVAALEGPAEARPGVEAYHQFSPALAVTAVANPDFSTVEPDDEVFNLTRFELRYPERRAFFQDMAGVFETELPIYYSRRIFDIYGGLKLEGKAGGFQYAALSAQSRENDTYEPRSRNFSVFRLRNVGRSYSLGLMAVNEIAAGQSIGAVGLDGSFSLGPSWLFTGQAVFGYDRSGRNDSAFFLETSYASPVLQAHAALTYLGRNFGDIVNSFGYIPDDNRKEVEAGFEKPLAISLGKFDRLRLGVEGCVYWGTDNTLRGWRVAPALYFDMGGTFTVEFSHSQEYFLFEKAFNNSTTRIAVYLNKAEEWQRGSLSFNVGRIFDGGFMILDFAKWLILSEAARLEFHIGYLSYSTPASLYPYNDITSGWALKTRFQLDLTPDLMVGCILHLGTKQGFVDKQAALTLNRSFVQLLVQYKVFPPYGLIQAGYQKAKFQFDYARPSEIQNGPFLKLNLFF